MKYRRLVGKHDIFIMHQRVFVVLLSAVEQYHHYYPFEFFDIDFRVRFQGHNAVDHEFA